MQNKKSTKRNLQAFRLTEAQIFVCGAIGSPNGLCANTLCSLDPPRRRYGSTSEPRRWAETSDFICGDALASLDTCFFHGARARLRQIHFVHMNYATLDESDDTTAFFLAGHSQ